MANDVLPVDLRSDTMTRPTPAMREAIASAVVGDDCFGEDPTVQRLEARVAEILGKEAAIYCASGTMCNQIAIQLHTRPGDEVILHEAAHPAHHEAGGPGALAGVNLVPLPGEGGVLSVERVREAIRPDRPYYPRSRLLMVENTNNMGGGTVWPLAQLEGVAEVAHGAGLRVHLDGARLWNASAASGVPMDRYATIADTVSVCFSKGLGAPVGSAIAGPADLLREARRIRQRMGGGWRQAGLLAAGALHAIEHHRARLVDDHENASKLAEGLRELPLLQIPKRVDTNILYVDLREPLPPAPEMCERLADAGVLLVLPLGPRRLRAVTHLDVDAREIPRAVATFREVAQG